MADTTDNNIGTTVIDPTTYRAYIFEHDGLYDVSVTIDKELPREQDGRKLVVRRVVKTATVVSLRELTHYLVWKFKKSQIAPFISSPGEFTNIRDDIMWIRSIIDVEFDFHIGKKNCMKDDPQTKKRLEIYTRIRRAGYGHFSHR